MRFVSPLIVFLMFIVKPVFGSMAIDLTPSADFFSDRPGYQVKADVFFSLGDIFKSPFLQNYYVGPGAAATGVFTNGFYFESWSLGIAAAAEWRPFLNAPFFITPAVLVGGGYAVRGDNLGLIDGLACFTALFELDFDLAIGNNWRAGLSAGSKLLSTQNYGVLNLQCGLHLLFRPGAPSVKKSKTIKR